MKRLALLCLVVFLVVPAFADTLVYTNATTWGTAVGTYTSWSTSAGAWPGGVAATTNYGGFQTGCCAFAGSTVWHDVVVPGSVGTTFTFANAISSFGAFWDLAGPGGAGTGINVYADGVFVGLIDHYTAGGFWGFTSTNAFTTLTLVADGQEGIQETYEISEIRYGVPEPGTLLLLGAGLLGLAAKLHRRS